MTERPQCPKGQRKSGSPCVFCEDGSYCPHQYYCPTTRRYENTQFRGCKKMNSTGPAQEVKPEVKIPQEVKKEVKEVPNGTSKADKRNRRKR